MFIKDYANKTDAFIYDENNDREYFVWWQLQHLDLLDKVEATFRNFEKEICSYIK